MATQISHDGFAREALMREKTSPGSCSWCGRNGRRWIYYTETDDERNGRAASFARRFARPYCSVGCCRSDER